MKIAHLIHTMGVAGAEKHLLFLLPELKRRGVDCELICVTSHRTLFIRDSFLKQLEKEGIRTTVYSWHSRLQFFSIANRIFHHLKKNEIKILHAHLFYGDLLAALVKTFFMRDVQILSTKHGYKEQVQLKVSQHQRGGGRGLYYFGSCWVSKRIDHHVAVSKTLSDLYYDLKLLPFRMKYIHHGISLPVASLPAGHLQGTPKILTVGRLEKVKGHEFLIRALPKIIARYPTIQLIVLGDGSLKNHLMELAARLGVNTYIVFEGFADPAAYAQQCQVMVIPALAEAFGMVYIESFALRLPLVAFDCGAAPEIIRNRYSGLLVPSGQVDELAETVIRLLEDPQTQELLVENAFSEYEKKFTVDAMALATIEWYHSVL